MLLKAAFAFETEGSGSLLNIGSSLKIDGIKYDDIHTVQINPASITHSIHNTGYSEKNMFRKHSRDQEDFQATDENFTSKEVRETLSMELVFDLATNLDLLGDIAGTVYNILHDLPTNSGISTSPLYSLLKQYAGNGKRVSFYWGKMVFCGVISNFDANYNYFNLFGNVLRAKANLTLLGSSGLGKRSSGGWSEFNLSLLVQRALDLVLDLTRN